MAVENQLVTDIVGFDDFIAGAAADAEVICFHAAEDKDKSVERCKMLLEKSPAGTAAVLNRYQGHQVKYMLEQGLQKCVIEPVYTQDIIKLMK